MKKFLLVLMAVCFTFAMISCGDKGPSGGPETVLIEFNLGLPAVDLADDNAPIAPAAFSVNKGSTADEVEAIFAEKEDDLTLDDWTSTDGIEYEFLGWAVLDADGDEVEFDEDYTFDEDTVFTAIWDITAPAGKAVIYFDENYGAVPTVTRSVISPGALTPWPTDPSRGSTRVFKGWWDEPFEDGEGEDPGTATQYTSTSTFAADEVYYLYAYWEFVRYAITFNWNYGATPATTVVQVQSNYPIGSYLPKDSTDPVIPPVRVGYEFVGWQTAAANTGNMVDWDVGGDDEVVATAAATYYARWWSTELTDGDSDALEKVALENGAYALYKFEIPAGKTYTDYKGVSATYKLSESGLNKDIRGARVMGAYRANLLSDVGGNDTGAFYKVFTQDTNDVWSIKWIAGTPHNGDYILRTVLNWAGSGDGNPNTQLAKAIKGYVEATPTTHIKANEWFTIEYLADPAATPDPIPAFANVPGRAALAGANTIFIGVGLTRNGARDLSLPQLIKDVKLLGVNAADDVIGTIPDNTFEEPLFAGYLTAETGNIAVQQSWRGTPSATVAVTQTADTSKVYRINNPVFKGYGDTNTANTDGSWTFVRANYGSMINYDFTEVKDGTGATADLVKDYDQITVYYTLTKDAAETKTGPMKLTITNRAHGTYGGGAIDWTAGINLPPFHNAWFDYGSNGIRYITLPLSVFSEASTTHKVKTGEKDDNDDDIEIDVPDYGYFFDIQHNDGQSVDSADNVKFNIRVNQVVFEK